MNDKLVRLWQNAHYHAKLNQYVEIDGEVHCPHAAIATMRYICKVLGVNEPPKECGHEYEPT